VKLLLDQGLARSAVEALRELGLEATHTGAVGMARASDQDILERARREGETVVTLDADFHALLALSNANAP
jgi:predicted nuclease of predicted toxin-antitoxin system